MKYLICLGALLAFSCSDDATSPLGSTPVADFPPVGIYKIQNVISSDVNCTGEAMDVNDFEYQYIIVNVTPGMLGQAMNIYSCADAEACDRAFTALKADETPSYLDASNETFFIGASTFESTSGSASGGSLCTAVKSSQEITYNEATKSIEYTNKTATTLDLPKTEFCRQPDNFEYGECNGILNYTATLEE